MCFDGFASGAPVTPLPQALLRDLAPRMSDPAELVVTLYAVEAISRVRRFPRQVARRDLRESRALIEALAGLCASREVAAAFDDGLRAAVARGSLLEGRVQRGGAWLDLIALNDADGRRALESALPAQVTAPWSAANRPTARCPICGSARWARRCRRRWQRS